MISWNEKVEVQWAIKQPKDHLQCVLPPLFWFYAINNNKLLTLHAFIDDCNMRQYKFGHMANQQIPNGYITTHFGIANGIVINATAHSFVWIEFFKNNSACTRVRMNEPTEKVKNKLIR